MEKQNLKVLHIVSISFSLRYFIGQQFLVFKERGVQFSVACSPSDDLMKYADEVGFKPFPVEIKREISPIADIISIWQLFKFIRQEKFDIVIAHTPKGGLIGMMAAFFANAPVRIYFRHGLVFETTFGFRKKLLIFIEKLISFCAHKVINVSPSIEKKSTQLKLNPFRKNVLLGKGTCNGVDIYRFNIGAVKKNTNRTVIGYVGRLSNDKGINELVKAWQILIKKYHNLELLLIGPLDSRDKLKDETIKIIEICDSISNIGEVQDAASYYNKMDIFILPSYREGFPTVTLEASASGLPVITSRSTGCIDSIIENETGIFSNIDPYSIANALEYYIENPEVAKLHGKNGRNFVVDNFSQQVVYKEIEEKIFSWK